MEPRRGFDSRGDGQRECMTDEGKTTGRTTEEPPQETGAETRPDQPRDQRPDKRRARGNQAVEEVDVERGEEKLGRVLGH